MQVRMSMLNSMMLRDWVMERLEEEGGEKFGGRQPEIRWGISKMKKAER